MSIPLSAAEFRDFRQTTEQASRPVTLNVQEAFMMYIKVSLVCAVVFASPSISTRCGSSWRPGFIRTSDATCTSTCR